MSVPKITLHNDLANPGFARKVEDVCACFLEEDTPIDIRRLLHNYALRGRDYALKKWFERDLQSVPKSVPLFPRHPSLSCAYHIGNFLIEKIVEKYGSELFPANDIELHLLPLSIAVASSSMHEREFEGQKVYFSRKHFTVELDGQVKRLAWTVHSMEQFCRRYKPDYLTYGRLGDAHGLLATMNYARPERLWHEGAWQPAVSVFDILVEGCWEYREYVRRFVKQPISGTNYAFRVGYFPLISKSEFFLARTFLPPGYSGTPERLALESAQLAELERSRLISISRNIDIKSIRAGEAFEAIEWFHCAGVKQLITRRQPVCDQSYVDKRLAFLH